MLRHQVAVLPRQVTQPRGGLGRPRRAGRTRAAAAPTDPARVVRPARNAAALAPRPGPTPLELPTPAWPPDSGGRASAPGAAAGQGDPDLGLPSHPRRAVPAWLQGQDRGQHRLGHPAPRWRRSRADAGGADLAAVPASPGQGRAGRRLRHRRHRLLAAAVRAVRDRGGQPPGPPAWGDTASSRGVGDAAGPQPGHGPQAPRRPVPVSHPGSGCEVHRRLRRRLYHRGDPGAHPRRCGRHGPTPTRSGGRAPFGGRCWTACSSSEADSCVRCWPSTPTTTTFTVHTAPWSRPHRSDPYNRLPPCRLGPSGDEIALAG
jgi:hypothetical protein